MLKQFWEVKHLWGMPPKKSGGSTKFPGGHEVIHRAAQTAFVRVVTPRFELYSRWVPLFRKRSLPFLTVDATIGYPLDYRHHYLKSRCSYHTIQAFKSRTIKIF